MKTSVKSHPIFSLPPNNFSQSFANRKWLNSRREKNIRGMKGIEIIIYFNSGNKVEGHKAAFVVIMGKIINAYITKCTLLKVSVNTISLQSREKILNVLQKP